MILSAVVTPTGDPFTLMAMTLPLYVLFEISLVVSRVADRATARAGEASLAGGAG
jgi:sec-independent protein translocase protein TatC